VFDKGLLVEDHRVAPYCPRCGTGLSDHEVAQGYETLTDPSVYVRLPVTSGEWAGRADLLVWTTTPWTLPSNTAVAMHPDVTYVVARTDAGTFVVAKALATELTARNPKLMTVGYRVAARPKGRVVVDYKQNAWGQTLASIYSVRPKPRATVSTPVTWKELEKGVHLEDFRIDNVRQRIAKVGDLWKPLLGAKERTNLDRFFSR